MRSLVPRPSWVPSCPPDGATVFWNDAARLVQTAASVTLCRDLGQNDSRRYVRCFYLFSQGTTHWQMFDPVSAPQRLVIIVTNTCSKIRSCVWCLCQKYAALHSTNMQRVITFCSQVQQPHLSPMWGASLRCVQRKWESVHHHKGTCVVVNRRVWGLALCHSPHWLYTFDSRRPVFVYGDTEPSVHSVIQ